MSMRDYFSYDPFKRIERLIPQYMGDREMDPVKEVDFDVSEAMAQNDPWLAENWGNRANRWVEELPGGGYKVTIKSGDKSGTVYELRPDDKGGFQSVEVGKTEMDTSGYSPFKDPMALAMMAAVGGIGAAGSGLLGGAANAAPATQTVAAAPAAGPGTASSLSPFANYAPTAAAGTGGGGLLSSGVGAGGAAGVSGAAGGAGLINAFGGIGPVGAGGALGVEGLNAVNPFAGGSGFSGTPSAGTGTGSGSPAGGGTPKPSSVADEIGKALGLSPTAIQALGGLLGAGLGYADAKSQEGKTQGGAPDVYARGMELLNKPRNAPTPINFQAPTMYQQPQGGLLGNVQDYLTDLRTNRPQRQPWQFTGLLG